MNFLAEVLNVAIIGRYCAEEEGTRIGIVMLVCISQVRKTGTNFHEILRAPYKLNCAV
jgi:hypothetical protein